CGLAFGYFVLIQRKTAFLVKFSFLFNVFVMIGLALVQIMSGSLFWGGLMMVGGLLVLFLYKYWAARMPFAVLLLQTVIAVTRKFPGTLAVSGLDALFVMYSLRINGTQLTWVRIILFLHIVGRIHWIVHSDCV